MPTYTFIDKNSKNCFTEFMTISSMEEFLLKNDNIELQVCSPAIVSGRGMQKPDSAFRTLLKDIKNSNSKGSKKSTIETF